MPKKTRKKRAKKEKRKVCEIFKVNEKGKEKTIKTCGGEEQKLTTKGQIKKQNKILKNLFIVLVAVILIFILTILFINSMNHFEYKGIKFDIVKEGQVTFYHTWFPIDYNGKKAIYNVYLRNDPRKLEGIVEFKGDLNLLEMMVINNTDSFTCEGDGGISIYNFQQILGAFGTGLMKDPDAICDSQGRYMFVKIQAGDFTGIEQTGPACYNFNVNNCEILKVTERFLIEVLVDKLGSKETS